MQGLHFLHALRFCIAGSNKMNEDAETTLDTNVSGNPNFRVGSAAIEDVNRDYPSRLHGFRHGGNACSTAAPGWSRKLAHNQLIVECTRRPVG